MKKLALTAVVLLGAHGIAVPSAHAIGCMSGAAVGAVGGHVAGHHAVLGAIAGCVVGHHQAVVNRRNADAARAAQEQPMSNQGAAQQNGSYDPGPTGKPAPLR